MKKLLFVATALTSIASFSTLASAADMAPVETMYDWSGVYIGLNAGGAFGNSDVSKSVYDSAGEVYLDEFHDSLDDDTVFTGGAILGYNWQVESFVFGLETDFNFVGFGDSSNRNFDYIPLEVNIDTHLSYDTDWFGTLRGRAGFAIDNVLLYATGGLAYGNIEAKGNIDVNGNRAWQGSVSDTNWGWTAGAGLEYAFDENWIVGAEYLYVDLGDADFGYRNDSPIPTVNGFVDVDYQFSVARLTLKYKF